MIYLSAIETLICRRKMRLKGSTSSGFAQNTWFSKYAIELIVALFSTNHLMPQKRTTQVRLQELHMLIWIETLKQMH